MKAGWTVKPLAEVCQIKPPKAEARRLISANDLVSFVPMEALGIDQKVLVPTQTKPFSEVAGSYTYFADGDVLLAKISPCFENGKLGIAANLVNGVGFGSSEYIVFRPDASVDKEWLYYFLARESFRAEGAERMTGAVGHKRVAKDFVESYPIPVPPLPEQQRIVILLDEAFDGIATARAHAEKNLQNARAIFESHLQSVFTQRGDGWVDTTIGECIRFIDYRGKTPKKTDSGLQLITAKNVKMGYLRKTPEEFVAPNSYEAWMTRGIPRLGDVLFTTEAPLANVAQLDTDERVVFAQRIIIMQPDAEKLDNTFLKYLLLSAPIQQRIHEKGTGATVQGIKASLLKKIEISFPSSLVDQAHIVARLDALSVESERIESLYQCKLAALDELKKSLLHQAFSGQLTSAKQSRAPQQPALQTSTPEFTANVISLAHARHERQRREKTFGRVKEQKVLHLVESIARIDLGRQPMKDAAGPNDFQHMLKAEEWAKAHGFFEMVKRDGGYDFKKLSAFDEHLSRARQALAPYLPQLESVIDLLVPMDKEEAEVFATVHAAWNNLLIDGMEVTDDAIVSAAREGWHPDKLDIPEHKFRTAIVLIRQKNLVPDGTAKYVGGQQRLI